MYQACFVIAAISRATNAVRVTITCSAIKDFEKLDIASSATRLVIASSSAVSIASSVIGASEGSQRGHREYQACYSKLRFQQGQQHCQGYNNLQRENILRVELDITNSATRLVIASSSAVSVASSSWSK